MTPYNVSDITDNRFIYFIYCKNVVVTTYQKGWEMVVASSVPTMMESSHLSGFLSPTPVGLDHLTMVTFFKCY